MRSRPQFVSPIRRVLLAGVLLAASTLTPLAAQVDETANAPRIPMAEFKPLMTSGKVLVIDVRDTQSFVTGHVPGAQSVPLDTLLAPKTLDVLKGAGNRPIVLYCA